MWIRSANDKLVNIDQFGCISVESGGESGKWVVRAGLSQQGGKGSNVNIAVCRTENEAVRILDRISALMRRVVLDFRDQTKPPAGRRSV